jgi:hypothetical protein
VLQLRLKELRFASAGDSWRVFVLRISTMASTGADDFDGDCFGVPTPHQNVACLNSYFCLLFVVTLITIQAYK